MAECANLCVPGAQGEVKIAGTVRGGKIELRFSPKTGPEDTFSVVVQDGVAPKVVGQFEGQ